MLYKKTPLDVRKEWIEALRHFKGIQHLGHPSKMKRELRIHCALSLLAEILGDDKLTYRELSKRVNLPIEIIVNIWRMNDGAYLTNQKTFNEIASYIESL